MDLYVFAILEMVPFAYGCVLSGASVTQCRWCDFFFFVSCQARANSSRNTVHAYTYMCMRFLHSCIVQIVLQRGHVRVNGVMSRIAVLCCIYNRLSRHRCQFKH